MCKWLLRLAVAVFCLMFSMSAFAVSRSMIMGILFLKGAYDSHEIL